MKFKCRVGDQHLTADGLSSARFNVLPAKGAPAGDAKLVIVSAPAEIISALGLKPGQAVTLTVDAALDEDDTQPI